LAWLTSRYEEYGCELACEEAVIKISGKDNIQKYGDTLTLRYYTMVYFISYIISEDYPV